VSAWLNESLPHPNLILLYVFYSSADWPIQNLSELGAMDVPLNFQNNFFTELLIDCNDILDRLLPHHRVFADRIHLLLLEVSLDIVNLWAELPKGCHVKLLPFSQST
jgi:hypothetical protein